jgi:hypothetical protein
VPTNRRKLFCDLAADAAATAAFPAIADLALSELVTGSRAAEPGT